MGDRRMNSLIIAIVTTTIVTKGLYSLVNRYIRMYQCNQIMDQLYKVQAGIDKLGSYHDF